MSKQLTYEYVKDYFEQQGCELLEKEYINNKVKMRYRTKCGHYTISCFANFTNAEQKGLCRRCINKSGGQKRKLSYKYVKDFFKKEGCKLLEKEYINNYTKMKYVAQCGCTHLINFANFQQNKGRLCRRCSRKIGDTKRSLSFNYVYEYFKSRGCELIDKNYINSNIKMKYKAKCGHDTSSSFANFTRGQSLLCKKCSFKESGSKQKLEYLDVKDFFKKEGCELLENKYINNRIKLKYVASCGHKWAISFNSFKNGVGRLCPECAILRGENSPHWKSNLTNEDRINRRSLRENAIWRKEVFNRDGFTCKITNKKGNGDLVVHHLKPYHKYKKLRFDVSNGITLNKEFHKFCHDIFGYKAEIDLDKLKEAKLIWGDK